MTVLYRYIGGDAMKSIKLESWILAGLMAAMTTVGTMLIQIPTPMKGYIHIGDAVVYLCGILLGPVLGGLAAGIGSMFADVFLGYGVYAPATLVIKAFDAALVALVYNALVGEGSGVLRKLTVYMLAISMGGAVMVFGYLGYETILYGFAGAVPNIPLNITQAVGGGLLAYPMVVALGKLKLFKKPASIHHN